MRLSISVVLAVCLSLVDIAHGQESPAAPEQELESGETSESNEPAIEAAPTRRTWVAVYTIGRLRQDQLDDALRSWFDPEQYRLSLFREQRVTKAEILRSEGLYDVRVWLVVRGNRVEVYLARADVTREELKYLRRSVPLKDLDLLAFEQLAQVTHSATAALLSGQSTTPLDQFYESLPKADVPSESNGGQPAASTPNPEATEDVTYLRLGETPQTSNIDWRVSNQLMADVSVRMRGDEPMATGVGVSGAVTWATGISHWGALLRAHYLLPAETTREDLKFRFQGLSGFVGALAETSPRPVGFRGALGFGLDRVDATVRTSDPTLAARNVPPNVRWSVGAETGVAWILGSVRLGLTAFVRYQLRSAHYQVSVADVRTELFNAWRLQPGLMLELGPSLEQSSTPTSASR